MDPGTEGNGDFVIGPGYTRPREFDVRPGVPVGGVIRFEMPSAESAIYPGIRGPFSRNVWVYVPKQHVPGTPAPFLVVQDGADYVGKVPVVLDNMIHDGRIPAMVAILIANGGGDAQGSERGLEYDTVSDRYVTFVETEVLPRVEERAKVVLTRDPDGRAAMGASSGAAAAFTMAWFRPDLYRRVLSWSGTFVNQQSPRNPMLPRGAWEYHARLIPEADPRPLRVYLLVGEFDNGFDAPESGYHNWVLANQRMAAALAAKGYPYRFELAKSGGHNSGHVFVHTFPGALEWAWRGYGWR